MSVNFCARAISERTVVQLNNDAQLATLLAAEHEAIDFDRGLYLARREEEVRPRPLPAKILARAEQLARGHEQHWSQLVAVGLAASDVEHTLELERAYQGLTWGWSSSGALRRLFEEEGGIAIGDDVGYGPARLFSDHDVTAMREAIGEIALATFAAAYHEGYRATMTQRGQSYSIAEEWEDFAFGYRALQRFVPWIREAATAGRSLLVWFE